MYYIYRITNKVNNKTYIGQHKYRKLNDDYKGSGKLLWRAYRKYGFENFEKEILYSRIQYKETADAMERFAIAKERALGKAEYNIADGGEGSAGFHHTDETRRRLSESHKGNHPSEEAKMKMSEARKGKPAWNKGKHCSDETKRKISESKKGNTSWKKGLKLGSNGTHWYNNGEINIKAKECPDGFVKGRLYIWR